MQYFTSITARAFKTTSDGTRLFYRGGPWSYPYLVPDEETEGRLFRKQLWFNRILLGGMIVGQPLLFEFVPGVLHKFWGFVSYLAIIYFVYWAVGRLTFDSDLRGLTRLPARLPLSQFARASSAVWAVYGVVAGLLFVLIGTFLLVVGYGNPVISWGSIVFFGLASAFNLYVMFVKANDQTTDHNG